MMEINDKIKTKFAKITSNMTDALLISAIVFLIINYYLLDGIKFIIITIVSILFSVILPIIIIIIWSKFKLTDKDIPNRKDRYIPLILAISSYIIGVVVLYSLNAPLITIGLMFCYISNTLTVLFINLFWKISIHSMGVTGPTTALIYTFGPMGAILGLLIPVVMWSRVYLKRHTMAQCIIGALLGFILTGVQLWLLLDIRYNIAVIPFLWLIFAIITPSILLTITGILNDKGIKDGYTRKIFHFVAFISIAMYLRYAPLDITIIFLAAGTMYITIACFSGNDFLWFDGIARKSDAPNEALYVVLPMISTICGLFISFILFGHPFVEIGMLCVAIGDAIAEPIGVRFGKHKYNVPSFIGSSSKRSLEGSISVLLACTFIIFFSIYDGIVSLLIGITLSIVEAISPRGLDNFTVLIVSSMCLWAIF